MTSPEPTQIQVETQADVLVSAAQKIADLTGQPLLDVLDTFVDEMRRQRALKDLQEHLDPHYGLTPHDR